MRPTEHIFILLKKRENMVDEENEKNTIVIKVKCSLCRILYTIWYVDPFRGYSFLSNSILYHHIMFRLYEENLLAIVCK